MTNIGGSAFSHCSALTSVTIPNSITTIRDLAFYGCSGLTLVTIPNSVTSIGGRTFSHCSSLTSVTIPNSVTRIGEYAFEDCSALNSVTIGSGIEKIRSGAFSSCPELTDVYCYAINVPTTETNVFEESYIENATLHVAAESINAYRDKKPWKNFKKKVALTDSDPKPDATRVNVIRNSEDNKVVVYNLNGVRLSEPQKGVNIINGKKYVKK